MSGTLHIVASCTDGKRLPPPTRLRLRAYRSGSLERRFDRWWRALTSYDGPAFTAENLYLGDHWSVCRDLPALARAAGWRPKLWVTSAGYGLVPADATLGPYAATFQSGHEDSVSRAERAQRREEQQAWWQLLGATLSPKAGAVRTLARLVAGDPGGVVLVAASRNYLMSMEADLADAVRAFRADGRLLVVSSPASTTQPDIAAALVPADARLQRRLGGARLSLYARVARWIVETVDRHGFEIAQVQAMTKSALLRAPAVTRYDRTPLDDDAVRGFIQRRIAEQSDATHTGLLRELRRAGRACEQSRFRNLFLEVRENLR